MCQGDFGSTRRRCRGRTKGLLCVCVCVSSNTYLENIKHAERARVFTFNTNKTSPNWFRGEWEKVRYCEPTTKHTRAYNSYQTSGISVWTNTQEHACASGTLHINSHIPHPVVLYATPSTSPPIPRERCTMNISIQFSGPSARMDVAPANNASVRSALLLFLLMFLFSINNLIHLRRDAPECRWLRSGGRGSSRERERLYLYMYTAFWDVSIK